MREKEKKYASLTFSAYELSIVQTGDLLLMRKDFWSQFICCSGLIILFGSVATVFVNFSWSAIARSSDRAPFLYCHYCILKICIGHLVLNVAV